MSKASGSSEGIALACGRGEGIVDACGREVETGGKVERWLGM